MSKPDYLFLDFDGVLFNYVDMVGWIDDFMVERFTIESGAFAGTLSDYYDSRDADSHNIYQFRQHIEAISGRSWSFVSGEIDKAIQQKQMDFCFDDVHGTVVQMKNEFPDVRILTYGDGEFQRFKMGLCRKLGQLCVPVHVVSELKADFLRREFTEGKGVIVDDKPLRNLPENWSQVLMCRPELAPINDTTLTDDAVSSLHQAYGLIRQT